MKFWLRWILLTLTIGGGFTGLVLTLESFFQAHGKPLYLILISGFAALYLFVLIAGLLFADDPQTTRPLFWALCLQVPWISSPFLAYRFSAGLHATMGIIGGALNTSFRFGSDWQFNLFQKLPWGLGLNLCALSLLFLLLWSRKVGDG